MKALITIDYRDTSDRFWFESTVKNKIVNIPEDKTIHEIVREMCEIEGMTLTYKGKPKGNVYVDTKEGTPKAIGYVYRGKSEIYDRGSRPQTGFFDVWVTLHQVTDFEIESID
ncbi:MAG: hypothetical protein PHS30_06915 [Bacteroidales bacterium]|nr:hypothetical protein [Bacteroidales bacterium]